MIIDVVAGELRNIKSSVLYLQEVMGQSREEVIKEMLKYLEEDEQSAISKTSNRI